MIHIEALCFHSHAEYVFPTGQLTSARDREEGWGLQEKARAVYKPRIGVSRHVSSLFIPSDLIQSTTHLRWLHQCQILAIRKV